MSLAALTGASIKLLGLFLMICRWVLVKMSLDFKLSGLNGRLSDNYKVKKATELSNGSKCGCKWKRRIFVFFLVALFGLCCFLLGASYGGLRRSVETQDFWKDKDSSLVEHFHVSKEQVKALTSLFVELDQITSLECTRESVYQMPVNNTIYCSLKVLSSVNHLGQEHGQAAKDLDPYDQCPVQYENIFRKIDLSLRQEKYVSFPMQPTYLSISSNQRIHKENEMQKWNRDNTSREHCESASFCLEKMCWLFIFGMAVSYKVSHLLVRLWRNRAQKQVKQRLSAQQEDQLLQQKQQQAQNSSKTAGKWRRMLLLIFVLAGVAGSIWWFWYLNEDINLRRKETLANMCEERARMLQDQFNVSMNHVHALAILISTFHHGKQPSAIDQKTFEEYTDRTAFERPLTSGVAYALRVVHSERDQIEKQQGWTIKKMESEDQTLVQDCSPENLDPSPIQDEYAPVIFSQKTVSHIVSIDMMSGKEDRENILRARASGKGVLTSPFKLLKSNHLGVVLTFAVYKTQLPPDATPDQLINATVGYIGASYDIPSLVEKLLHQLAIIQTIVVNVYDTTNISAPIKMYGTDVNDTGLLRISNIDFGDPARRHEMHCRFKHKPPPPWTAITASVGVLVITLLVGHIFHAAINSIAQMQNDCWNMMELKRHAEAADIAKSQFLATVSHEIRTPMNGVLGMLQMLMDTNLDSNQFDYAQTAHNSGKDLISLINEVLDQAKIESGKLELEHVPFNLRVVLDNVVSIFSGKLHEKRVELAIYVSNQVPEVVIGDPGRLRQIITNLVGNSIKFTHEGHVFVTVHLASEVRNPLDVRDEVLTQSFSLIQDRSNTFYNTLSGSSVADRWKSWANFEKLDDTDLTEETGKIKLLVTVEDTGVGILPEAEGCIFMPFIQADSSTSRKYGGTGIGLSISKRLVELMKGEIGFASKRGIGSTFSFTAILTKGEVQSLDIKWHPFTRSISEFHGLKALIVDGKSIRTQVTKYHLQRLGISVDICSSVESACSFLSSCSMKSISEHFGVILVDEEILDNAGLAFQRLLKLLRPNDYPDHCHIPPKIVLLATCINSTKFNELKSAGFADNILTKPLRLSVFISCFQEATGIGRKRKVNRGQQSTLGNLLKDRKILVVDDNIVNRRVAEGALKNYGAIVTCVDSGKAALEKLKPPHKFDACFMDLQMPEMDGFEATRQIRSLEKKFSEKIGSGEVLDDILMNVGHWHTPILAMTADVIQATNEECTKCGMDDYVLKPFEKEQLYSAAARFFESG